MDGWIVREEIASSFAFRSRSFVGVMEFMYFKRAVMEMDTVSVA